MKSFFNINSLLGHKIQIVDTSEEQYAATSDVNEYSKEQCAIINIFYKITSSKTELLDFEILPNLYQANTSEFTIPTDGEYEIYHIILPTKQWFDIIDKEQMFTKYQSVYYYDKGKIKRATDEQHISEVKIEDLVNTTDVNTLVIDNHKTFSIDFIYDCYINYCKQIFNLDRCTRDSDLIWRRDFVWMTINVIKYYIELNQLDEAQNILERIGGCNGICGSNFNITSSNCGCGAKI